MLIAQLSDLHLGVSQKQGKNWEELSRLNACIEHINNHPKAIDLVLVTGDLTEDGWPEEYQLLRQSLDQLVAPFFIIPGNHDRRQNLLAAFSGHHYLPPLGTDHVLYSIEDYPLRLIGVDSALFGQPYGELCEYRLQWLAATLNEAPTKPTIIFMHHPPIRIGIDWIDAAGLYGASALQGLLRQHSQVLAILCGHVHRPVHAQWQGCRIACAPSVHQSIALSLATKHAYSFAYAEEPLSMHLHHWNEQLGFTTHLSYVPTGIIHAPAIPEEISQRFRQEYDKLYKK